MFSYFRLSLMVDQLPERERLGPMPPPVSRNDFAVAVTNALPSLEYHAIVWLRRLCIARARLDLLDVLCPPLPGERAGQPPRNIVMAYVLNTTARASAYVPVHSPIRRRRVHIDESANRENFYVPYLKPPVDPPDNDEENHNRRVMQQSMALAQMFSACACN